MKETWIMGIRLSDRGHDAIRLQSILTKYGCTIRTRLGLHETDEGTVSTTGLILLELTGDPTEFLKLENELLALEGVTVRKMVF